MAQTSPDFHRSNRAPGAPADIRVGSADAPSTPSAREWAARQYATVQLPDARLKKRLLQLSEILAGRPQDSINQASENWCDAKGAYRFVENERVAAEALQEAISETTARDCAALSEVIAVQDTTVLSFASARQAEGLGPINDAPEARGMLYHPVLALGANGIPLGLLHQQQWCRDPSGSVSSPDASERAIDDKESVKWLRGIQGARRALTAPLSPEERPRLIHVFDREGDVHEVFETLSDSPDGAVIRSAQNRRVLTEAGRGALAQDAVRAAPLLGTLSIDVPRKQGQRKRDANVQLRACKVRVTPNRHKHPQRQWLELTLVEVWESRPPQDTPPVHWLLWTTESAGNLQEALHIVSLYKLRWKIEEFFLVLKSGCRLEALQFSTADRLAKVLALYAPIAVRIVQLRDLARRRPDAPCTEILADAEWKALWTHIHKQPPPLGAPPPTLKQAALWIGRLGGHLGRASDGMPGVRSLWRGWRDLSLLASVYSALSR